MGRRDAGALRHVDTHPEYHGLKRCPFCGSEKPAEWLTCSRPSCEREMLDREARD